jgi:transcriptional regulator GlxA family with amidase domain
VPVKVVCGEQDPIFPVRLGARAARATTHHGALDELRGLDSSCEVRSDVRWVDDGDVLTAAGVSAVIDLALHLVDRHAGTEMAKAVRAAIQYDPLPPV